jgi:beta-lactam-binding protein with PASTA domain
MVQALTRSDAVSRLIDAGYRVSVKYGPVTTGPGKGQVYFQDPEPYAVKPLGTLVEIWISTGGPAPYHTPYYPKPLPSP